jgi:hypothetical protein
VILTVVLENKLELVSSQRKGKIPSDLEVEKLLEQITEEKTDTSVPHVVVTFEEKG